MSTLDLLLSTAVVNGLRQFNVTRIGTGAIQWQAATRWHGRDGYCVAIRDTPEEAAAEALSAHPLPSSTNPAPVTTETPHAYAAPNAPDPDMAAVTGADRLVIASGGYPMPRGTVAAPPPKPASLDDCDDTPELSTDAADDLDGW